MMAAAGVRATTQSSASADIHIEQNVRKFQVLSRLGRPSTLATGQKALQPEHKGTEAALMNWL